MRLYSGSSQQFIQDSVRGQISEKLKNAFFSQYRYNPSVNEVRSWQNSLRAMSQVVEHSALLDHGVLLEYQLPLSSKRLDCIICGKDENKIPNAVIVELKQWEHCEDAVGKNEVVTWVGGANREVLHPSVQVGQYRMYLEDTHPSFYSPPVPISLSSCVYLHNHHPQKGDVLFSDKFSEVLTSNPLYTADDFDEIKGFLRNRLKAGEGLPLLSTIEENRFRPSKKLMEHVSGVIKGNAEYILLDEQLVVYDKVFACVKKGFHHNKKTVLIVNGGPGTGKSVIALNLMADLLNGGYNAHYATGSRAFTETLRKIIGTRGSVQFKYFNSYGIAEPDSVDVLICDESHRIREYSWSMYTPKANRTNTPQIEELINAAKVCVFFIDDRQVVRPNEVGSKSHIAGHANKMNCDISDYRLDVQFRCAGSESFVNWINNTLGIEPTANVLWQGDANFDFRIFETPQEVEDEIRKKENKGISARLTAGFCWPWSKKPTSDGSLVEDVIIEDYKRPWNARPEATRLAPGIPKSNFWAYDPNGINQVGCIYTAQGFEFDYVGVIVGKDLVYDFKEQEWVGKKEHSFDTVVKRSKEKFVDLVKNTYRVLLSRGLKGCYVCFLDKDTEHFVRSRIDKTAFAIKDAEVSKQEDGQILPFRYLQPEEVRPYENCVPLYDLKIAAGSFSDEQSIFTDSEECRWVELREPLPHKQGLFVAQVIGESMNRRIANGSYCLFKSVKGGSRQGKVVLVQHREIQNDDMGGHFTVKIYSSTKNYSRDGTWKHKEITLRPDTTTDGYETIVLDAEEKDQLKVIAELVAVLG